MDTNVSEEHAASIYRAKMCRVRNQMDYMTRLHGGWSLRSTGRGNEINPMWYNRNSEKEDSSFRGHRACSSEILVSPYVTTQKTTMLGSRYSIPIFLLEGKVLVKHHL
jgi:hypothetical protein